jgi:hypothetical protein
VARPLRLYCGSGPNVLNAFAELLRQVNSTGDPSPKPEPAVIHDLARIFMRGLTHYGSDFRHASSVLHP